MTRRPPYCAEHALRGYPFVSATTMRDDLHLCDRCAREADAFDAHMAKATQSGGPYRGMLGSKGGGASADMATILSGKAGPLRRKCLEYIIKHGAIGADALARELGADPDVISPRLSELTTAKYGHVLRKGARTAETDRKNKAHVYELTEKGRAAA